MKTSGELRYPGNLYLLYIVEQVDGPFARSRYLNLFENSWRNHMTLLPFDAMYQYRIKS